MWLYGGEFVVNVVVKILDEVSGRCFSDVCGGLKLCSVYMNRLLV